MNMKKKTMAYGIALLLVAAGMIWFAFERTRTEEADIRPLKMIVVRDLGDVGLIQEVAQKKGFFEKNGVRVEAVVLEKISDTRNVNTVLLSGEADMLMTGVAGELAVYLNGADVQWIAKTFTPFSFFAASRFDRANFDKIRTVGVIRFGGEPAMLTDAILRAMQIDPKNVKQVAIPTNMARAELLEKGEIDLAIINSEQFMYETGMDQRYSMLSPEELFAGSDLYRGIITTSKVIERDPEAVRGFVMAIHQALEYLKANPEEAKQYMREAYGYSNEQAERAYERFAHAYDPANFIPDTGMLERIHGSIVTQFKPTDPGRSMSGFVDDTFARNAVTGGVR